MQVRWKKLLLQSLIWVVSEALLSVAGLDDLADYSEFLFDKQIGHSIVHLVMII